jgi:hypothetical protein
MGDGVLKKVMGWVVPRLMHTRYEVIAGKDLGDDVFSEMWGLTTRYVDRDRAAFRAKLAGCEELFLVRRDGVLIYYMGWRSSLGEEGGPWVAFTIPFACGSPAARGHAYGTTLTLLVLLRLLARHPRRDIFVTLACSTNPGYVHIARHATAYWPRPGVLVPERIRAIAAAEAREDGYADLDLDTLVVHRRGPRPVYKDCLNSGLDTSTNPYVRNYVALNPGQENGDTLLCVATWDLRAIPRLLRSQLRGPRRGKAAPRSLHAATPSLQT